MRSILKSSLGRASTIIAIVGLALFASGVSAEARDGHGHWDRWGHWHGYYAPGHWYHGPYYGYRYYGYPAYAPYYAPPVVYGPPAYYGPPSYNFTIPLG